MSKYLGSDPGRSKTGVALVDSAGKILALHMEAELRSFTSGVALAGVIMGNGTNHKVIGAAVRSVLPKTPLELVGEAHSTEEARSLYWQENPPQGWRRLVPLGMLVPPEPLDAYAAVVQVRRWLALQKNNKNV